MMESLHDKIEQAFTSINEIASDARLQSVSLNVLALTMADCGLCPPLAKTCERRPRMNSVCLECIRGYARAKAVEIDAAREAEGGAE